MSHGDIAKQCSGDCAECALRTECKDFLEFMDAAGNDFQNQYEIVIEELFNDPDAVAALESQVFNERR